MNTRIPEPHEMNRNDARSPFYNDGYKPQVQTKGYVTTAQIKLLQVARREIGLSEEEYRNLLGLYGGVDSAKNLTQKGFEKVMQFLKVSCGFSPQLKPKPKKKYYSDDPVSPNQNRRIIDLFKSLGWDVERQRGLCRKLFKNLWPMNRGEASRLIETLKDMEARGYGEKSKLSCSKDCAEIL